MLRSQPRRKRTGFTLIEILLAALLAVLVLAGVYAVMHVTVQQVQVSRDAVEAEDLARGIFNKMERDTSSALAPLPPKSGGNSAASGGTTAPSSGGSTPSTGMTPTDGSTNPAAPAAPATGTPSTTTPTTGTADATMPGATDNATAVSASPPFQGGVYCQDPNVLVLFLGRTPEAFGRGANPDDPARADQRQVIYKFVEGRGLFRAERAWVTSDDVTLDLDPDAPESRLLADEVLGVKFEFADGTPGSWASTWDGTSLALDGASRLGPPRAIKVTLTLKVATNRGEPVTKNLSQVIVVRAAPGTFTPTLVDAPTDGGDNPTTGGTTPGTGSTPSTGSPGGNTGMGMPGTGGTPPSIPGLPSGGGMTPTVPSVPSVPSGGGGMRPGGSGGPTPKGGGR